MIVNGSQEGIYSTSTFRVRCKIDSECMIRDCFLSNISRAAKVTRS
jgi:hypothetical protein